MPKRIRVASTFSGIGAFEKALMALGYEIDLDYFCEFDKYAAEAYSLLHNVPMEMNIGDITKVDEKTLPKNPDLFLYGFPCIDISMAGLKKGLFEEDGSKTRSGLVFDALRIIKETKPRICVAENVKALTFKKMRPQFDMILGELERIGYKTCWSVLQATEFGIPQNRERVFIVSVRNDIPSNYTFPWGFPLEYCLRDFLEPVVDKKYYLSDKEIKYIDAKKLKDHHFRVAVNREDGILMSPLVRSGDRAIVQAGNIYPDTEKYKNRTMGRVCSDEGLCPTLTTPSGGSQIPIIFAGHQMSGNERGRIVFDGGIAPTLSATDYKQPVTIVSKIKVIGNTSPSGKSECNNVVSADGIYPTIAAGTHGNCNPSVGIEDDDNNQYLARRLTPKECLRLQGFSDEDADIMYEHFSDTQIYKRAGNAICVNVAFYLFKEMEKEGLI